LEELPASEAFVFEALVSITIAPPITKDKKNTRVITADTFFMLPPYGSILRGGNVMLDAGKLYG
jgi:hypothetical protein